jgi:hypothetical protein
MVRDAHCGHIALNQNPLMLFGVLQTHFYLLKISIGFFNWGHLIGVR